MVDAIAIDLGARFWANKSTFTRISFKVVLEPGSAMHAVRLKTARSERLITVVMDKTQEGAVRPSSQVSSPTGAFALSGLSGIVSTPGWSGTTSEGKPFYWRQVYIAESDPVTVTLDNAAIEEYTEDVVPYDPNFPYVFTEYSGKGEWVSCIGQFGGGNLAELVRRTSGTTEVGGTMSKGGGTMWLSLFIALITYLLSPKDTSAQRKRALLNAAVAGGVTYGLTEYTDWGREVSNEFDDIIGVGNEVDDEAATNATKPVSAGSPGTGTAGSNGSLWSTLTSWGATGTAAVVGTAGATVSAASGNWLPALAIGAAALLILK